VLDEHLDFDCVGLDLQLPDMEGFELLAELNRRRLPVSVPVMSVNDSSDIVHRALKSGAAAYLSKSAPSGEIRPTFGDLERKGRDVSPRLRQPLKAFRAGVEHIADGR
jgi:two-component system, NarL family, invasion response regulator UvrY